MKGYVIVAVLLCVGMAHAQNAPPSTGAASTTGDHSPAVTGNGNTMGSTAQNDKPAIPPSEAFMADVDSYVKLVAEVQELEKKLKSTKEWHAYVDTNDRAMGMQLRITQQIPRGYMWDPKSKLLVPVPAPPVVPAPAPPVPAPPPSEEKK